MKRKNNRSRRTSTSKLYSCILGLISVCHQLVGFRVGCIQLPWRMSTVMSTVRLNIVVTERMSSLTVPTNITGRELMDRISAEKGLCVTSLYFKEGRTNMDPHLPILSYGVTYNDTIICNPEFFFDMETMKFFLRPGQSLVSEPTPIMLNTSDALCYGCPSSVAWASRGTGSTGGGTWSGGEVPYVIDSGFPETSYLRSLISQAIGEFDNNNVGITWSPRRNEPNYVRFVYATSGSPNSKVGCIGGRQDIKLPERYSSSGNKLRLICVMHEMCHTVGLQHEMCRSDRDQHITVTCHTDHNFLITGHKIGHYDYYSIMHYGHGTGFTSSVTELQRVADTGRTFSTGDICALRRLYCWKPGGPAPHGGKWHHECSDPRCDDVHCFCGACKRHENLSCGYTGRNAHGHWSCCMSEDHCGGCNESHTGFWHMRCWDPRCTSELCYCHSCGGGCTYTGHEAHWSCCGSEDFHGLCPADQS
ncbi:zinc metalloproteinase nas-7 [Pelomyxa schiedti]|nr:zinc metalloproteinase nas-7 [Pelomyxa schiedti]